MTFSAKNCLSCDHAFSPRSGAQLRCDLCREERNRKTSRSATASCRAQRKVDDRDGYLAREREAHAARMANPDRATEYKARRARAEAERRARLRAEDPDGFRTRQRAASRRSRLMVKYGLTEEQHEAMIPADGLCPICLDPPKSTTSQPDGWVVDHCHETGNVRGLICATCNSAGGLLGADPTTYDRAKTHFCRRAA